MHAPNIINPKRWGNVRNFRDDNNGDAVEKAFRFGNWIAACRGNRKALNFCEAKGINVKGHTEGVNSAGGYLVPEEFETDLITLREQFGVFRQRARIRPMGSDTLRVPRRSNGLTAYFVGEATAGTESTQTFESVLLVAKKMQVLATVSNELNEDAFVNLDDLAGEISYAFAKKEDECGFIGDGTSTYGGIQGVCDVLSNGTTGVQYYDAGLTTATDIGIADIHAVMALLPQYADSPNCAWYMHKSTWHAGFEKELVALGGTSGSEVVSGYGKTPSFLGYPVIFSQAMPSGTYNADDIVAIFGDLSLAASMGDRRSTSIEFSTEAYVNGVSVFETDQLAVRGTERFDINVHDTGDATTSGPVVGLFA
jgi:HK97 family phage major capsid protein